ncbi:MAG: hypothetical protein COC01_07865 [Bacteroidetes bacterium]|nr:MAG: hypothetical protein COC01_07865 [Bacteroidota bacterium]
MKCSSVQLVVLIFLSFFLTESFSQDHVRIDSLKRELKKEKNDSLKIKILNKITWELIDSTPDTSLFYSNQALQIALKIHYTLAEAEIYSTQGILFRNKSEFDTAIGFCQRALVIYQDLADKNEQNQFNKSIAQLYNSLGNINISKGNYSDATNYYHKALNIYEKEENTKGKAITFINIGTVFMKQRDHKMALEYNFRALSELGENGDEELKGDIYNNLGGVYYEQVKDSLALVYYLKSLEIDKHLNDKQGLAISYLNIGNLLSANMEFEKAVEHYFKAIQIQTEIDDKGFMTYTLVGLGETYQKMGDLDRAIIYLKKCVDLSLQIGAKKSLQDAKKELSNIYAKKKDFKQAIYNHKSYSNIKDSLFNESSAKSMNEMQTKYESEKKEKEIDMLTKDNELQVLKTAQQEGQIKKQWYLILGIVFILVLAISLVYVVFSQFKFKKQANYELEFKNDLLEMINRDLDTKNRSIAESINYAQRIQETIMPTQNHLNEIFPESFIFYKAKDVVSGDFPWLMQTDKYFFAAAIDCTGHGVPGAMMSMIGYFLLNDIVGERKIHDPAEILEELHKGIKQTLKQDENLESNDGLDIALCTINKEEREVQYAGAHRPLIWLHQGKIQEIKGDRLPIGGLQYSSRGKKIKFTNHKLKLDKGDSIYFYSDGLTDQIGGLKGRKFQNEQVKKIILDNLEKPMVELKDIFYERFNKWMGNEKQLDDVIMLGIKV